VSGKGMERKMEGDGKSPLKPKAGLNWAPNQTFAVVEETPIQAAAADEEHGVLRLRGSDRAALRSAPLSMTDTQEVQLDSVKRTREDGAPDGDYSAVIPWLMAEAEPNPEWWVRMRRDPKRAGEVSQLAFLLKAKTMGFKVALPWGDSERWDCVVWMREGGPMLRVQVKGTGRLYRRGYEVQPVHSTRGQGKKRYTKREIDVLVGMCSRWMRGI
jgi:hypothetical protein